jgi:amidase
LLKDNINTQNMATTAGAVALQDNQTEDAFIVQKLKENGALILGKANLSEWAYFFCGECPSGYSAIGGQTLNPYGRKVFDTGGSSSGSAVAVAANLAPVAIGSETSGSILSPSSQNSVVGLKPTIGNLSRGGIVPISSYLDTPGPITKSVVDNTILYSAMTGKDTEDVVSVEVKDPDLNFENANLEGKRFGAFKELMKEDSLYSRAVNDLKNAGAEIVEFEAEDIQLENFLRLLSLDMKNDLPEYFAKYGGETGFTSVEDIVKFNKEDYSTRMPYGQSLFLGIVKDSASSAELDSIKSQLTEKGKIYFDVPMQEHNLDGILSINNYHAGFAAVAHYPAITVPMGYDEEGAPKGLTFFTKSSEEDKLYQWAFAFEQASNRRQSPKNYE